MSINWSVHLFIVCIKQHGCKHDSSREALFGLWFGCSQTTIPPLLHSTGGARWAPGYFPREMLTQPRLRKTTYWEPASPPVHELTFPSQVSSEKELLMENLELFHSQQQYLSFKFQPLHHFPLMLLTLSLEQRHFQNVVVLQSLSQARLFVTPWTAAHQASLSITISQSLLKFMCTESVMLSNHLILCFPLLLLPSVFPNIRVFSSGLALCIRWPKYWSFSFSISPSNKYSGLISFRIDWFDLLAIWGTLKNLLQHHNLKASILWHSAFLF